MAPAPPNFPCDYALKLLGRRSVEFRERMLAVLALHANAAPLLEVGERLSRDGSYVSLSCTLRVDSREQLERIYADLYATGLVLYAL